MEKLQSCAGIRLTFNGIPNGLEPTLMSVRCSDYHEEQRKLAGVAEDSSGKMNTASRAVALERTAERKRQNVHPVITMHRAYCLNDEGGQWGKRAWGEVYSI